MFVLGAPRKEIHWKEAGVYLTLTPLTQDIDEKLMDQVTTRKATAFKRDAAKYAQLVGRECIKGWRGVKDQNGDPVECGPEAIEVFMLIDPAQEFVFEKVKGLDLHLVADGETAGTTHA